MELKTRIVLRNDSTANWLANESQVLLKGEVGIEFLPDGKAKMKVGDGTKTWAQLDYFGDDSLTGDNLSVEVADGVISIKGFKEAVTGAQLIKGADGTLSWQSPDTTTEGLAATIEVLKSDVSNLQAVVGEDANGETPATGLFALINEKADIDDVYTKDEVKATIQQVKYEIFDKPANTIVDYRDKEIRVMCPADTVWELQNVGASGDSSKYYISLKAYAPNESVVSFKEDLAQIISDETMYFFEGNDFAGIDEYGRKYSIVWLPVAGYDAATQTWTYYGANSATSKYIGWHYTVAWYDADGNMVGTDTIRINLSNEDCHNTVEPFYMNGVVKEVSLNGTLLDIVNGRVDITAPISSDEQDKVSIAEDGTMEVNSLNVSKLIQTEGEELILNGGSSK